MVQQIKNQVNDLNLTFIINDHELKIMNFLTKSRTILAFYTVFSSYILICRTRYLKVNTDRKVPDIKFDDKWVPDSDVITQTLEEKYPSTPLVTPPERATAYAFGL